MQEVGGDRFLLSMPNVSRRTTAEICDGLIPVRQKRGVVCKQYAHKQFRDNLLEFLAARVDPGLPGEVVLRDSVTNSAEEKNAGQGLSGPALRRRSVMNPHKLLLAADRGDPGL